MRHLRVIATLLFGLARLYPAQSQTTSPPDTTRADQLCETAEQKAKQAQFDSANVYLQKAANLYEKSGSWQAYVSCHNKVAAVATQKGAYDQAMAWLEQARKTGEIRLGAQHPELAASYNTLGAVFWSRGDYDQALEFMQKGLAIRRLAFGEKHPEVASSYHNIGTIFWNKGDYGRALEYLQKGLEIRRETLGETHPEVATSYNNIALVHAKKGDDASALEFHQQALTVRLAALGGQHPHVAESYHNIGLAYSNQGDHDRALGYFRQALDIRTAVWGERHPLIALSSNAMGVAAWRTGELEPALAFFQNALDIAVAIVGEQHPMVAGIYNNIGLIHKQKGDHDRALEFLQKALEIKIAMLGESHPDIAESHNNLGEVYRAKGETARALEYHEKALQLRSNIFGEHHPALARSFRNIGLVHEANGDLDRALAFYQKALLANTPGFEETDPSKNPALNEILSEQSLLETLTVKALTLRRRYAASRQFGDLRAAFSSLQLLDELIDRMRSGYKAEGSKLLLAEKASSIYENAIRTALALEQMTGESHYKAQAFGFAEKAKAVVLSEALLDARAKQFAGIPDSLLAKERLLRADLAFFDTRIQEEKLKREKRDSLLIRDYENRFFELNRSYVQLIDQLESDYPRYHALKYRTPIVAILDIQQQLDEQTALLEYFVGDSAIYIFTISKRHFEVIETPRDPEASGLEKWVAELREGISKNHGEGDYRLYTHSAWQLYRTLLQPVAPMLRWQNLVIVPDGVLNNIPFETLLSEDVAATKTIDYRTLPYLVKKHAISYAYSANLFAATATAPQQPPPYDYLAFAPVFAGGLPGESRAAELLEGNRGPDSSRADEKVHLPASKQEVLGIKDVFQKSYSLAARMREWLGEEKARVYLEKDASEHNLKQEKLQHYRYLHLATHGFANESSPDLSGLAFTADSASTEDGVLYLPEIYNLELNAELVVVSACESGTGRLAKGEGLIGLARGFLYAGARNLLVSQWKVNDWSTADLMQAFYAEMLRDKSKSEALRAAKMHLLRGNPDHAKPYHWAAFILIGR